MPYLSNHKRIATFVRVHRHHSSDADVLLKAGYDNLVLFLKSADILIFGKQFRAGGVLEEPINPFLVGVLVLLRIVQQVFGFDRSNHDVVHEVKEELVFGHEVSLAVDLHQGHLGSAGSDHRSDDSFTGFFVDSLFG